MILFVVNPESGKGKGKVFWEKAEKYLKARSVAYEVWHTKQNEKLTSQIRDEAKQKKWQAVVAIGGDGTVNEVGSGLIGGPVPFGIIPSGTGNDFAFAHAIPSRPEKALARILKFQPEPVDTATVNGQPMFGSTGVGFDVSVVDRVNRSGLKKWFGSFSYGMEAVKCLFSYKSRSMTLKMDGNEYQLEKCWMVSVANIRQYGGGIRICPQADTRDGYLDVCCVQNLSKGQFIRAFPLTYFGWHTRHPAIRFERAQQIEILGPESFPYHIDGEVKGTTPVRIEVHPRSLLLL
jgi:diacylglycerol kinase (ATP)